ncbi:MAG: hypothetical protein C4525_08020 [Desulfarculus sp.]|jgi:Tol biopolymer transport system component|nr:MAG: hypothetical protein C4525_08020 [Desulfarculus sp.]
MVQAFVLILALGIFCTACISPYTPYEINYKASIPEVYWASFSPNNDDIVFSMGWGSLGGIFLMDRQGKIVKWLRRNTNKWWSSHPVFSPDGQWIAFVSTMADKHGDIFIMDKEGNNIRRLTSTADYDRGPVFSPDGKRIYFVRSRYFGSYSPVARKGLHENDIFYVEVSSGREFALTDNKLYLLDSLNILPSGDKLLLGTYNLVPSMGGVKGPRESQRGYNLWSINIAKPHQWTPVIPKLTVAAPINYSASYDPVLSLNGKYLVFTCRVKDGYQIFIADMNTMETHKIDTFIGMKSPVSISMKAKEILFVTISRFPPFHVRQESNLWIVNRDGTGLRNFSLDFSRVLAPKQPNNTSQTSATN